MIKVLIVEDEIPAQINLKKLIDKCCDQSRIVMTLSSVRSTIKWLQENPEGADVIFMDVEIQNYLLPYNKYPSCSKFLNF